MPISKDVTIEELENELNRRKAVLEIVKKNKLINASISSVLTEEMVHALIPEHGRTSCSDTALQNGFGSATYGPRCTKCALLEVARGIETIPDNMQLVISWTKLE